MFYGAVHLEAATFDQMCPTLKFRQFFNPSWENVPFDALNKTPRAIFLWIKFEQDFYIGTPQIGAYVYYWSKTCATVSGIRL